MIGLEQTHGIIDQPDRVTNGAKFTRVQILDHGAINRNHIPQDRGQKMALVEPGLVADHVDEPRLAAVDRFGGFNRLNHAETRAITLAKNHIGAG